MQTDDLALHVLPLGGVWETIGVDRLAGITPEGFVASANEWGSDTAGFDLRRDPGSLHPDLAAFTPLEAEIAGEVVWSGRTLEAPTRDGLDPVINIQAQGWQYHLDDDVYAKAYVHTLLAEWRDARSFPTASLATWMSAPTVATDSGAISLSWPKGGVIVNGTFAGVILDLGPSNKAASISVDWVSSNNSASMGLYARAASDPSSFGAGNDAFSNVLNNSAASGTNRGTFPTPTRYVALFAYNNAGADVTPGADVYFQLTGIRLFTNDAWRSTDASILHASDIVKDAVAAAAPLITDTSQVQATTFAIPDFHFEDTPQSPREAITAANALHNYITKVDADKRIVFAPRPTAPLYEIGAWGGADFQDASAGSGGDIYNRILVTGTGTDGTPLIVSRTASQQSDGVKARSTVSTTWVPGGSTTPTDNYGSVTGPIYTGQPILIVVTVTGASGAQTVTVTVGNTSNAGASGYGDSKAFTLPTTNGVYTFLWTPTKNHTDTLEVLVTLNSTVGTGGTISIDLYRGTTVVDRRGFQRTKVLPVNAALTTAVANQLGDVYLAAHKAQPLKGNVDAVPTSVRRIAGGDVHPAHLLRETGQRLRLSHRIDPDTGGQARDGMIATVTYTHDARQAAIALDEDRRNFDVLLARFAAVSPAA